MANISVIGLMSGSSLDGLDMAWCEFTFFDDQPDQLLEWKLHKGFTSPYPEQWKQRLKEAPLLSGRDLWLLHTELGHYFGRQVKAFQAMLPSASIDLVASHGHTVFHFPLQGTTTQIGDGAAIAAELGCVVIDQFRSLDMALGGQGAPLAPLADKYLLSDYAANINIGGIANISLQLHDTYIAFDVGGANQVLDALVQEIGLDYDDRGQRARSGQVIPAVLAAADALPYFTAGFPKSLGNDWVRDKLLPIFQDQSYNLPDRLRTFVEHLAGQIKRSLNQASEKLGFELTSEIQMLVAGGGGFNTFLCERIAAAIQPVQLVIAKPDIIAYKEAALMALAGALRWLEKPNVLHSVTGARYAAVGGAIHYGKKAE